jgi:hypothetical protein
VLRECAVLLRLRVNASAGRAGLTAPSFFSLAVVRLVLLLLELLNVGS